jgi:hypothetical protein
MISNPKNDFERMFGPYPNEHCFEIENCATIKRINNKAQKGEGVKIVELLLLDLANKDQTTISLIEAKTSVPQSSDDFISDVQEKFCNSLSLFVAIHLQRHVKNHSELPDSFTQIDLSKVNFILILAIQTCQKSWLPPIQEKLHKALKKTIRIWNISPNSVIVLNEAGAKSRGLIRTIDAK